MQYTPPQSPDLHHPQSHSTSSHLQPQTQSQSQPFKFPPSMDHHHHHSPLVHEYDTHPDFTKRPISPPLSSGEISDSHRHHSHPQAHGHAPVSLLSALMHSPPSTGLLSPHSSAPSTAVSSPHLRPVTAQSNGMGGLEVPAMSILRRDSFSSDGEALAGIAGQDDKAPRPQVQPQQQADGCEMVKRASSLKFAVAPPSKRRPSSQRNGDRIPPATHAKFDTSPDPSDNLPEESPTSDHMEIDAEIDEEDLDVEAEMDAADGSEESDLGYQEDSELSSDEDELNSRVRGPKYLFARSTNYRRNRRRDLGTLSTSPPPAPAVLPPPARRGRGHIRMDESCISGKETEGGCSRHRSPPPSKSASGSRSGSRSQSRRASETGMGERIGRLSDAGPRQNRAGSPMPTKSKILQATDVSEEEDEEEDSSVPRNGGGVHGQIGQDVFGSWASKPMPTSTDRRDGWRSDDAAFSAPGATVRGIRNVSAPGGGPGSGSAMMSDEEEQARGQEGLGVRQFFRRASEHLPMPNINFGRTPSVNGSASGRGSGVDIGERSRSPGSTSSPCPPALDDTPALALPTSIARVEVDHSGGLAHRLEKSLSRTATGGEGA